MKQKPVQLEILISPEQVDKIKRHIMLRYGVVADDQLIIEASMALIAKEVGCLATALIDADRRLNFLTMGVEDFQSRILQGHGTALVG